MKKMLMLVSTLIIVITLSACQDVCVGAECILTNSTEEIIDDGIVDDEFTIDDCPEPVVEELEGTLVENALEYIHIDGYGNETPINSYVLFEFEVRDYVKYQITYLSCTCRDASVNYWQVAYVEINKTTNDIRFLSFGLDSAGHYLGGMWGDSSPTPAGHFLSDFEDDYIPWLVGKSLTDLDGISVFTNADYHGVLNTATIDDQDLIDSFAGSSVSTNNMLRIMKVLLEYHEDNY